MITVRFRCGHEAQVSETASSPPVCACGETQVTHTQARAPRFVGACTGPYAEVKAFDPATVALVDPAKRLVIRQEQ